MLIGSADLMERNLDRRVETLCYVRDVEIRDRLRHEVLETLLADTERAGDLRSDGTYGRSRCRPAPPALTLRPNSSTNPASSAVIPK